MTVVKNNAAANGFNRWTLNGEAFSMDTLKPMYPVHEGRRYRLKFRNASDDIHPLHLHRHSFELARIGGKPTAASEGRRDAGRFQELEFDFGRQSGQTSSVHQQLHGGFRFAGAFQLSVRTASLLHSFPCSPCQASTVFLSVFRPEPDDTSHATAIAPVRLSC